MAKKQLPVLIERDEDGAYVVECPTFEGCYTQGATLDEALHNLQEVIALCLEEERNRQLLADYQPGEWGLHLLAV